MIDSGKCIGCQICSEMCPKDAISFSYNEWGEGRVKLNTENCVGCGICDKICPALTQDLNESQDFVYAAVSKKNRKVGSSGGIFYEIASEFIKNGGIVYGAAFNEDLQLIHKAAESIEQLSSLCKSKYIHSDMSGIYKEMEQKLSEGTKVLFVGTPCQASAVKNAFADKYSETLTIADFLCHGTGTQKIFDACLRNEEAKKKGKIVNFEFRSKSRKAEHSFTYTIEKNGREKNISGYSFEFPYYHAYLQYTIFNDYCYFCEYACRKRVGDITFGDFWGIQKYNNRLKDYRGVSMLSVNTENGKKLFESVVDKCIVYKYPTKYATDNNQSFNIPEEYPKEKIRLKNILSEYGDKQVVKELECKNIIKNIIYINVPKRILKVYDKIRGRI